MSAPASTKDCTLSKGSSIIRWQSLTKLSGIALTIGGPTVNWGQKTPSMTSMCTTAAAGLGQEPEVVAEPQQVRCQHADADRGSTVQQLPDGGLHLSLARAPWARSS